MRRRVKAVALIAAKASAWRGAACLWAPRRIRPQPPHHLRDAGAAGLGPPRQIGAPDDGHPGLPDGGHALAILRQADQVVTEGGLQIPGQVEPLLLGPAVKAGPVAEVGPLGVPGPGGLSDLVAPGEGRVWSITGGGNGLGQQNKGLHKCRINAFIRHLWRLQQAHPRV